eukprot:5856398-Prymnesium_polylepis.1
MLHRHTARRPARRAIHRPARRPACRPARSARPVSEPPRMWRLNAFLGTPCGTNPIFGIETTMM